MHSGGGFHRWGRSWLPTVQWDDTVGGVNPVLTELVERGGDLLHLSAPAGVRETPTILACRRATAADPQLA